MSGNGNLRDWSKWRAPEVVAMARNAIDRRAARTRTALHHALMSLVRKKGYDSVTVDDICEAAHVGRSTFYSHYAGKDDLKRSGVVTHLRRELLEHQENVPAASGHAGRPLSFSLPMFEHARDHIETYRALVGSRGGEVALGTIREMLSDLLRRELAANGSAARVDATPRDLVIEIVVGVYMTVLRWYLDNGAKLPPERVDAMFRRLATEGLLSAS
jgi:AcrR family transcriptional regulator